ncbi:MAG: ATP-binding protein [Deltaproteobacteria bacterium]|nr:ATP-binding protein [Deltaproteobacteria bacterium]
MTSTEETAVKAHADRPPPPSRLSLHWKLISLFALLLGGGLVLLYLLSAEILRESLLAETEANLRREAIAAREAVLSLDDPFDEKKVDGAVDGLVTARGARITVIREDGTVIGDSVRSGEDLLAMGNQSDRPEFRSALEGKNASSLRPQTAGRAPATYASQLYQVRNGKRGVILVELPLLGFEDARDQLRQRFILGAFVLFVLILYVSGRVMNRATRDIQALGRAAVSLGGGSFGAAPAIDRDDAIGDLSRTLDGVREKLRDSTRQITDERDRLQEILGAMEEGVLMIDEQGTVLLLNPALQRHLDLPPEPIGRKLIELVRNSDLNALVREGLEEGKAVTREVNLERKGVDRTVLVRLAPVQGHQRGRGAVIVFHDITETRRLEQMRRDFVANVSHELKTPLTAIRGYAETLAEAPPDDPAQSKTFVETILRHAKRLGTLVEDLLELSRIESGQAMLKPQPVDLRNSVDRVLLALEPNAVDRRVRLMVSLPSSFPALFIDPSALETILRNLIDNAVKYVNEGGRVEVRAHLETDMAHVEVVDSGPGIPTEHLTRIFERFYRVDPSRSKALGGTGLGLAIVKHLSQASGGRALVDSEPGRGSVFTVVLPLARAGGSPNRL